MDTDERAARAASFGAIAPDYDRFRPGPPAAAVEWLLPADCRVVVDIGAGTGALTRLLVDRAEHVIAIEPDERMRAVLAERVPAAELRPGQAEAIPLPDGSADAVLGSSMWHWVDADAATAEIARVLRPGGVLGVLWGGPDRSRGWLAEVLPRGRGAAARAARELTGNLPHDIARDLVDPQDEARLWHHELRLSADAPFREPERHVIEWEIALTPDQLIGLAGTFSGVIRLPDAERARALELVAEVVRSLPELKERDTIDVPMRCTCWRAVRTDRPNL